MNAAQTARSVAATAEAAATASREWARADRTVRAAALDAVAARLDAAADELVPTAMRETHLPEPRLRGELGRTTFQLRLFAEVLRDGSYLDARIDTADPEWPMGPRPDIRRTLVPLGPVAVFAASNFPFAFSVIGGDSASALAAGNAVVVKTHPGHPDLSAATAAVVVAALAGDGAPQDLFQLVSGIDEGRELLLAPQIRAGAFTGSIAGGRALFDLAQQRPDPIPFFGELGSVNPVFVTREAARRRAEEITAGFVGSFTLGAGQFCTKPGVLVHPRDSDLRELLAAHDLPAPAPLLNDRIQQGYVAGLGTLAGNDGVEPLRFDDGALADPPAPSLVATDLKYVLDNPAVLDEVFGPASLLVAYDDEDELLALAELLPGQLTATVVGEEDDRIAPALLERLADRAGRVLWNQWPTGVTVSHAQQHGGPYPATTAPGTTSVGTAAITRFLRPVAFQNLPQSLLPAELRDGGPAPALVNGTPSGGSR
ncbi:aldehyde dehydrogenase (NADP(+)) [Pseudonocardia nematodicida]|uniref:Aldehyde dehydrogenase (NADP(+)) n=1 Tax=Pseudonocardia nematodicida TaxID=1206997 RepID=A0ABV1K8K4_9PSEU